MNIPQIAIITGGTGYERDIAIKSSNTFKNSLKEDFDLYILPEEIDNFLVSHKKYKLVIPVFHGEYGEDGTIFGLLKSLNIKHTFSSFKTHVICMNKNLTNLIIQNVGIKIPKSFLIENFEDFINLTKGSVPKWIFYSKIFAKGIFRKTKKIINTTPVGNFTKDKKLTKIREIGIKVFDYLESPIIYPAIVKPNNGGSSVATYKVNNEQELQEAVKNALELTGDSILIQEYITGQEYSIPVIGNDDPEVLPIMKLELQKGEFFDYDEKYNSDGTNEIFGNIEAQLQEKFESWAKTIYRYLGCRGIARIDCIVNETGIYFLEVNTIPGFSDASIFPKAWKMTGRSMEELISKIVELGLE